MIPRAKKKCVLGFFGIFGVLLGISAAIEGGKNGTVVMKINGEGGMMGIQPRMMINRYNLERKGRKYQDSNSTINDIYDIDLKENSTSYGTRQQYFPQNMGMVIKVLQSMKNENCIKDTTSVLEAMARHEKWALELFDSFSKFPMGILYGNYYQLGNFDECIGVNYHMTKTDNSEGIIQGQYCLADIYFERKDNYAKYKRSVGNVTNRHGFNNSVLHWGICLPSSCTTEEASIFTRKIFASAAENFEIVSVTVNAKKCYFEKTEPATTVEIVYGCCVGIIIIFIVLATALHMWHLRQRKRCVAYNVDSVRAKETSTLREILECFSLITTTGKFLHTKPNEFNLECICGIKFLSMAFIICGHSLLFIFGGPIENVNFIQETTSKIENGQFVNNPLLVDTFLLVSGFLMCRLLLLELDKRKGINVLILYIARYIRLTPAYIIMIGLQSSLLYRLGSGPLWEARVGTEKERCMNSWWTNILYINNYVNTDQLCMFQSWYLAVDYHLFIIAPLIIYPLWRWRRLGESFLFISVVGAAIIPFWITYRDDLDPTLMAYAPEIEDISTNSYFKNVYIKTHMRASSYFIGIFFGYLVHNIQRFGIKIPSYVIYLGWILSATLGLVSMYSICIFFQPDHISNMVANAIYSSLHRVAWCLAIGWILVACITDNAPIINGFLSWKPFVPASRLTYCAYLANGCIEVYNMGVTRQAKYLSRYELVCTLFGHLIMTFGLAFVLCIFFESPIHGIEKILLKHDKSKEQKQNTTVRPLEET